MNHVIVYHDAGVSSQAFRQLIRALREVLPRSYRLKAVDHNFFLQEDWEKRTVLVVFPGGRDSPYHEYLKGKANERIAGYVRNGGAYLGICAGGYYGAAEIIFEKGGELEICASRELKFFPGKAVGPAYGNGKFRYESEAGAQAAQIKWEEGVCHVYFNGGCFFEQAEAFPGTQILARYHDLPEAPAAVVACRVDRGRALLSGVHPEYTAGSLKKESNAERAYLELLKTEQERRAFWRYLINYLIDN